MEVKASTFEAKPLQEKPIHVTEGVKLFITGAPTATSPPNGVWIPISMLSTQRRLSCAPSVPSAHTIWIHSRGMRRSISRAFFGVDLG